MIKRTIAALLFLLSPSLAKKGWAEDHTVGRDAGNMFKLSGRGFVNQFQHLDSILLMGGTAGGSYLFIRHDARLQQRIEDANVLGPKAQKMGDVGGYALNGSILGLYAAARTGHDEKFITFSIDTLATHLLVLIEVAAVSHLPMHKRPNIEKGREPYVKNSINDIFRGKSSFPSGHVVGAAVLMFKGSKYYGWKVGVPAAAATGFISWARIEKGDHYVSDIFCTLAMTGIASLSTSRKLSSITQGMDTKDSGALSISAIRRTAFNNPGTAGGYGRNSWSDDGGALKMSPVFLDRNNWSLVISKTF